VYPCLFGRTVNGAKSWLGIGSFGIQPSEFSKIAVILFLARYLDGSRKAGGDFKRFIYSCAIVFIPMGLVLMQPDFGTALVFLPILLVATFMAGISLRYVLFLVALIALTSVLMVLPLWQSYILRDALPSLDILMDFRFVAVTLMVFLIVIAFSSFGYYKYKKTVFYWILYGAVIVAASLFLSWISHKVLKDYQIMRLIVFLDPYVDPRGSGWNIIQSITAIGSGGLFGKGFLLGTQSHYRYLPQQSTDFIFSIFSEEWGFVGGLFVFVLFLLICLRLVKIMKSVPDNFGVYFAAGLSGMFIFHFLINVGMTMGIMPITGIPLPFMSYGGSSLLACMSGIGICLSVYMRRYEHIA
jgi:rod shape determining protein RodA